MRASSTIATALLALAPAVQAVGNAYIQNKCDFDVYVWAVSVGVFDGPTKLSAGSAKPYSQPYKTLGEGGMSMKLSKTEECDKITQFEYTLGPEFVWYDISNVNCVGEECPFQPYGMYMSSGEGCPTVTCPAGNATCGDAYTLFNDDWASKACSPSSDTTLYLCSTSADGSSDDSGSDSSDDDDGSGYIGASTPAPTPSSSYTHAHTASKHGGDEVAAAAVETPSSSSSSPPPPPPSSTLTSSYSKPTSSKAAPTTTSAPPINAAPIETTVIEYYTQWATSYVEAHHHKPRTALHPHARRHQHHL